MKQHLQEQDSYSTGQTAEVIQNNLKDTIKH